MKRIGVLFLALLVFSGVAVAQDLSVITAIWAPYDMEENGTLVGIGTEIVQATLAKAGIKAEINVFPFARALKMAEEEPNTLLFTVVKSPEREPLFTWVGPIVPPVRIVMHKLKKRTDIVVNSLEDAKQYTIGTTRASVGHQYLLKEGFQDGVHVDPVNSNQQSVKNFFGERVDLEVSAEFNFMYEATQQGFSVDDTEIAYVLFENQAYMVFNKRTPDDIVEKVRTAFEQVKAEGFVDAAVAKYLKRYQ